MQGVIGDKAVLMTTRILYQASCYFRSLVRAIRRCFKKDTLIYHGKPKIGTMYISEDGRLMHDNRIHTSGDRL